VRESWQERFAELPDAPKIRQFQQTNWPVLKQKTSGPDFFTAARSSQLQMRFN
jgi:hypothetical protein